jgi:hypothetical protein
MRPATRAGLCPRALIPSASFFALAAIAVASACASFEESKQDAPDGFAADGAGGDAPSGDATRACVPEPIEPFDAGVEDARCNANSENEVNLAFSSEHCGFCGHACAANTTCMNSACTVEEVVTTADHTISVSNATTATHLYFIDNEAACAAGHVRKTELGKTGSEDVLVETGSCLSTLFLSNDYLYYLQTPFGIRRTPLQSPVAGGAEIVPETEVAGFAATSTALLVVDKTYGRIARRQLDGQSPATIHEDLANPLSTFGSDSKWAWWSTEPAVDAGPGRVALWGLPPGSVNAIKRAAGLTAIRTFALDDEYIYLLSDRLEVVRLKMADDSPAERVTSIETEVRYPRGISVIGDYLYMAVASAINQPSVDIYRAKKCGGRARLVAHDPYMLNNEVAAAGGAFYFSGGNSLKRFVPTAP